MYYSDSVVICINVYIMISGAAKFTAATERTNEEKRCLYEGLGELHRQFVSTSNGGYSQVITEPIWQQSGQHGSRDGIELVQPSHAHQWAPCVQQPASHTLYANINAHQSKKHCVKSIQKTSNAKLTLLLNLSCTCIYMS